MRAIHEAWNVGVIERLVAVGEGLEPVSVEGTHRLGKVAVYTRISQVEVKHTAGATTATATTNGATAAAAAATVAVDVAVVSRLILGLSVSVVGSGGLVVWAVSAVVLEYPWKYRVLSKVVERTACRTVGRWGDGVMGRW